MRKKKPTRSWRAGLKEHHASAFMHAEANIRVHTYNKYIIFLKDKRPFVSPFISLPNQL